MSYVTDIVRVYHIWRSIRQRCVTGSGHAWRRYGGRGITLCPAWRDDFEQFFKGVGVPPSPQATLDRCDNNDGYRPGNIRWATKREQNRNRSTTILTARDAAAIRRRYRPGLCRAVPGNVTALAKEFGISKGHVRRVYNRGAWR